MTRGSWIWIPLVVAAALGLGLAVGRGTAPVPAGKPAGADPPPAASSKGRTPPPPLVGVAHPKRVTIPVTLSLTANISSLRTAVLYSKTAGYLETVTVRPGDPVRTGQLLAVVDHAQLDAQAAQADATALAAQSGVQTAVVAVAAAHAQLVNAEAQVQNAKAGVVKARAQLQNAQATQARIADLVRQGAAAQQTLDDAVAQVQADKAGLDAAQAQVAQADAQVAAARQQEASAAMQVQTQQAQAASQAAALHNARLAVANATITAPFDGIVVSRSLDPGAYVAPGTSTPILTIADLDQINVTVNVTEVQIAAIQRGAPAQVTVDAYPDRTFRGTVSRIAGGADPITRTVQVEIDIANPGHLLRPGMYATAQLSAGADKDVLVVPLGALVTVGDQHFVWVVKDSAVTQQPVTVGRATGEVVEVTAGLSEGDQIVARGADLVREGQRVRAVPVGGL
ncbi:MAG: efflux RND transporter periplasmic adaptor subunit [Bacillati bacterium ANGP1]|uniref:Efflux RND transporter periplasmic adaptor subunit n=1 Tax=Candidatus Segetimicrobium genomatis TaxID=2569760 RepID=A0A537K2X3_9BACT|nr:MAG: efflux RND transporter periplasmic adaptor subunit [Terrabacteria group bacterium ANGP1]